jgi:hypothetical protein
MADCGVLVPLFQDGVAANQQQVSFCFPTKVLGTMWEVVVGLVGLSFLGERCRFSRGGKSGCTLTTLHLGNPTLRVSFVSRLRAGGVAETYRVG